MIPFEPNKLRRRLPYPPQMFKKNPARHFLERGGYRSWGSYIRTEFLGPLGVRTSITVTPPFSFSQNRFTECRDILQYAG